MNAADTFKDTQLAGGDTNQVTADSLYNCGSTMRSRPTLRSDDAQ